MMTAKPRRKIMPTPVAAASRTKQFVFFSILATAGALVSLLTVYKLSVANAYRVFELETAALPIPTDAASLLRGAHLSRDVLACQACHGQDFGGQVLMDNAQAVITAPNLTDKRSDETWVRALRLGVDGEGRGLWVMPTRAHSALNDRDLTAVIASIRAEPAVARRLPQSHLRFWGNWAVASRQLRLIQTSELRTQAPGPDMAPAPDAAYGAYLAQVMQCTSCHAGPQEAPTGSTQSALQPGALQDVATFRDGVLRQHPAQKAAVGTAAIPLGGFERLTIVEFEALWRYFKGA
jgi:hypothetical protein